MYSYACFLQTPEKLQMDLFSCQLDTDLPSYIYAKLPNLTLNSLSFNNFSCMREDDPQ